MSAAEFRFLSLDDVLELHEMQLESYGGATGIRASDLLESAVMVPQASFGGQFVHADVYQMAAAYAFHIDAMIDLALKKLDKNGLAKLFKKLKK